MTLLIFSSQLYFYIPNKSKLFPLSISLPLLSLLHPLLALQGDEVLKRISSIATHIKERKNPRGTQKNPGRTCAAIAAAHPTYKDGESFAFIYLTLISCMHVTL